MCKQIGATQNFPSFQIFKAICIHNLSPNALTHVNFPTLIHILKALNYSDIVRILPSHIFTDNFTIFYKFYDILRILPSQIFIIPFLQSVLLQK